MHIVRTLLGLYLGWFVVSLATAAVYILLRYLYQVLFVQVQQKKLNEYTQLLHPRNSEIEKEDFIVAVELMRPEVSTQQPFPNAPAPDGALL